MVASTDELAGCALAETEAEAPARRRPTAPARRTAFALLCRMLSHSDTPPAGFDRDAAEIDWVTLIEIANRHRVVANLAAAAAARPWPADPAPDVMAYLALVHEAQAEHNRAIRRQILDLAALLAEAGIPFAFLKGANWLMEAAEPELGNRMLTDIDLVLAPHAWDRALASLEGAGYRPATDAAIYRRRGSPQRSALARETGYFRVFPPSLSVVSSSESWAGVMPFRGAIATGANAFATIRVILRSRTVSRRHNFSSSRWHHLRAGMNTLGENHAAENSHGSRTAKACRRRTEAR